MSDEQRVSEQRVSRRSILMGAAAAGVIAGTAGSPLERASAVGDAHAAAGDVMALWRPAYKRGIMYGAAVATWQLPDIGYRNLVKKHAAILWTQDDLLWYVLKPTPESDVDFSFAEKIVDFAERNKQLVFGGPLVWDEGFGPGWKTKDLWDIHEKRARKLLFGTLRKTVRHFRGRIPIWDVCNEVVVNGADESHKGLRLDVPWINTIGPEYVSHAFHLAHEEDRDACLVLNEFGFETDNQYGDRAADKRHNTLRVLERLLSRGVPVHALGVQAHLLGDHFHKRFHDRAYRRFLREVSDMGLQIMITELDVLDDGLPHLPRERDTAVARIYRDFLDVALDEPAVSVVSSFGLSDRYTSLQEDVPPTEFDKRRPLAFDRKLRPKPAFHAIRHSLRHAPKRWPIFKTPRHIVTRGSEH